MKKTKLIVALLAMSGSAMAQFWNTNSMSFDPSQKPILGTQNQRSLFLVTNDSTRVVLDSLGNVQVSKMANKSGIYKAVYVTPDGNLITEDPANFHSLGDLSYSCFKNVKPWYEGGNNISGTNHNIIGTCNNVDFVLEVNSDQVIDLKPANSGTSIAMVGIGKGNSSPTALVDISDPRIHTATSSVPDHTRIYGDYTGGIEATYDMNLYYADAFHISAGNHGSATNYLNIDASGNFGLTRFLVQANGQTYIGGPNLTTTTSAMFTVGQPSKTIPALVLTDNSTSSNKDYFKVLGSGYTEIDVANPTAMPGNRVLTIKDTQNSRDLFVVKADGKVYAREVEISNQATFPDYVFANDYKLRPIDELQSYVNANKHLPGFEKGEHYEKNGMNVSDLLIKQQEKIEELSLYIFELNKRLKELEKDAK